MRISIQQKNTEDIKTQALAIGYWQDTKNDFAEKLDKQLNNTIQQAIKNKEFTAELLQTKTINTLGKFQFDNLIIVGLGKQKEFDTEKLRRATAAAIITAKKMHLTSCATNLHTINYPAKEEEKITAVVEASILSAYHFSEYKTTDKEKITTVNSLIIIEQKNPTLAEKTATTAKIVTEATCLVRDLVNQPASHITPITLAQAAQKLPKPIKITVYDKKALQKMNMGAILAVNKGSSIEPRLIILEYKGSNDKPIALVGKGVTFDSGGLNIKSETGMETMKMDMAGAAAVIGTFKAAAELKLPVNLIGVLPCTENMINGEAYKPGDIIHTYSGKTIEVANTDAEGRVILADALTYAQEFKPKAIIDLATLTGACVVALGPTYAGIMGTADKLITSLITAGKQTGEKAWQLPLTEEFKEAVKSDIADVRNLSIWGRDAGAITGAEFLNTFIKDTPWAHIDIAGTAWAKEDQHYLKKGATGYGVRLLMQFLMQQK